MGKQLLALGNVAMLAITLYMNYLAGTGQLFDVSPGEVSAMYPTLFTPAGITFAIWSIIYLLNIAFVSYQLYKAFRNPKAYNNEMNISFLLVCIVNIGWLFSWHSLNLGLALALMLLLLVLLSIGYINAALPGPMKVMGAYLTEYVTFSVYLGWISVATIANVAILLTSLGIPNEGGIAAIATVVVISVAVLLGLRLLFAKGNFWYPTVILWALYGIYAARDIDVAVGAEIVKLATMVGMITLTVCICYQLFSKVKSPFVKLSTVRNKVSR